MRESVRSLIVTLSAICAAGSTLPGQAPARADSIVLERTLCFGTCPAYRLRIASDGSVRFDSRNPGDAMSATDRRPPETIATLLQAAAHAGFFALPKRVADDRVLCPLHATNMPSATITVFSANGLSEVEHYYGCMVRLNDTTASRAPYGMHPTIQHLYTLASQIDSVLDSQRWVRPASRR
jgi:hypothetical protein